MLNYTYDEKTETLTITAKVDSKNLKLSGTQKSYVVATSNGNVRTSIMINGKPLTIGVNAYISAK